MMAGGLTLGAFLARQGSGEAPSADVISLIHEFADAAKELSTLIALGPLAGDMAQSRGLENKAGDSQKELDAVADGFFIRAAEKAHVAYMASEELEAPLTLDPNGKLAIAIDPLDGSSNIATNAPIGTIFSILPATAAGSGDAAAVFMQPGSAQLAAGFIVYGAQTSLVLTLGSGVSIFVLDRGSGEFVLAVDRLSIPPDATEFAINASNYRHWDDPVRAYIDDCILGAEGPLGANYNMRWIASLVADAYRIFVRGGIYLYPGDRREGYKAGRLRLLYEANPIAFVVEQAGGGATDGVRRILDLVPTSIHQRTPLVFGSATQMKHVARYHAEPTYSADRSPLFGRRGLLRA
jgi:fructose-1,6-bisphosphatase I